MGCQISEAIQGSLGSQRVLGSTGRSQRRRGNLRSSSGDLRKLIRSLRGTKGLRGISGIPRGLQGELENLKGVSVSFWKYPEVSMAFQKVSWSFQRVLGNFWGHRRRFRGLPGVLKSISGSLFSRDAWGCQGRFRGL